MKRLAPGSSRLRLRPTPSGWALLALALVLCLMAINEANNLLYAQAFLILSLTVVQAALGWWNLSGLYADGATAGHVIAGCGGLVSVRLQPGGRRRHALHLQLLDADAQGGDASSTPPASCDVAEAVVTTCEVPWLAIRRGWQRAHVLRISSSYPLGLTQIRRDCACELRRLVWPAPLPSGEARPAIGAAHRQEAAFDFTGVAPWRTGDPPRRLVWRALARGGQPLAKRFDGGDSSGALVLRWQDCRGSDEQRLAALARLLLDAHAAGRPWVLSLPGEPDARTARHGLAALQVDMQRLALYGAANP